MSTRALVIGLLVGGWLVAVSYGAGRYGVGEVLPAVVAFVVAFAVSYGVRAYVARRRDRWKP